MPKFLILAVDETLPNPDIKAVFSTSIEHIADHEWKPLKGPDSRWDPVVDKEHAKRMPISITYLPGDCVVINGKKYCS